MFKYYEVSDIDKSMEHYNCVENVVMDYYKIIVHYKMKDHNICIYTYT